MLHDLQSLTVRNRIIAAIEVYKLGIVPCPVAPSPTSEPRPDFSDTSKAGSLPGFARAAAATISEIRRSKPIAISSDG